MDNNLHRKDRTLSAYLKIAMEAAREAMLVHLKPKRDAESVEVLAPILRDHTERLKSSWLRQRGGGIRGWRTFLRLMGLQERLTVEKWQPDGNKKGRHTEKASKYLKMWQVQDLLAEKQKDQKNEKPQ